MNEKQLRALLRKEIKSQLNEASGTDFLGKISNTLRSKLGSGRGQLNVGLSKVDPEQIAKMTPEEKANLVAKLAEELGLTAKDFNTIKQRIARKLGAAEKDASTTQTESKVSTTIQKKTDKTFDTQAGEAFISSLEGRDAMIQADIIINMLKKLPLDKDTLTKLKGKLTQVNESKSKLVKEYLDDYVTIGEFIAAGLTVLGLTGVLAKYEIEKAKREAEKAFKVKVTPDDMESAEAQLAESRLNEFGSIPADLYASGAEIFAALLLVLGGTGFLAGNEILNAKRELEQKLNVKISKQDMQSAAEEVKSGNASKLASALGENKRKK